MNVDLGGLIIITCIQGLVDENSKLVASFSLDEASVHCKFLKLQDQVLYFDVYILKRSTFTVASEICLFVRRPCKSVTVAVVPPESSLLY